ncbi:substrate-binding domain-containing protein [Actinoplanes sp. NPDC026619]|uniref:sugar ABC transporter substrate-binding protein n=1 Tax=Actinoplanes sp. NPDC026619 TaxID=3155798 RepID=UPI003409DD93
MMKKAGAGVLAITLLTACTGPDDSGSAAAGTGADGASVGVIITNATSESRWKSQDPVYFREAFRSAGITADVRNASNETFQQVGTEMIRNGAQVLIITSPDADAGKAVIAGAHQERIPVIDYDRLTVGGAADYLVSFDPTEIGRMQGYGLMKCLDARRMTNPVVAELNGAVADHNADQLSAGHEVVLEPKYDSAEYTKGPSQNVPAWAPTQARDIFAQMIGQQPRIGGVLAADDGIADAAIDVLRGLKRNGEIPVTGQNASIDGLRNIMTGDQCMTVYKRTKLEAQSAANIATQLVKGKRPAISGSMRDPETNREVPFVGLVPLPITVDEIKDVVSDGFVSAAQLCADSYQALCKEHKVIP